MGLNNPTQITKMKRIHKEAVMDELARNGNSKLRSMFAIDEVDKVYPTLYSSMKEIWIDNPLGVTCVLGVTGTEDNLHETYPEWAHAELLNVVVNEEKEANHRGIHHSDAIIKHYKQGAKEPNVDYVLRIIRENLDHFCQPRVHPRTEATYYPKTIALADQRVASHKYLANEVAKLGFHQIMQNGANIKVRRRDRMDWTSVRTSHQVLRNVLMRVFDDHNLWDGPVLLTGFKKIDRGLGYHFAPPDGSRGLIWTDEIMGLIAGEASKSQRVHRTAGVIAHCPDYPNQQFYWVDPRTDISVRNNNYILKELRRNYFGFHTVIDRIDYAKSVARRITKPDPYKCIGDTETFPTHREAVEFVLKAKNGHARPHSEDFYRNNNPESPWYGKYETSLTNSDGEGRRPYTCNEYVDADKTLSPSSLLVPNDIQTLGISCRILPLNEDDTYTNVIWAVRFATTKFECGEGLTVDDVLQQKYPTEISYYERDGRIIFTVDKVD